MRLFRWLTIGLEIFVRHIDFHVSNSIESETREERLGSA